MNLRTVLIAGVAAIAAATLQGQAQAADFFNGFEADTSGWSGATRVATGAHGIASATGGFHAEAHGVPVNTTTGTFTQWGGYQNVFPEGGYITSIDIYLLRLTTQPARIGATSPSTSATMTTRTPPALVRVM
jgi:hypothetical protein